VERYQQPVNERDRLGRPSAMMATNLPDDVGEFPLLVAWDVFTDIVTYLRRKASRL
jgi:hypothetical protein